MMNTNTRGNTGSATDELKSELQNAFQSANSVAEKLEKFQNMVNASCFQQSELAAFCMYMTWALLKNSSPSAQQVFKFAKTALSISNNYHQGIVCFDQINTIDNAVRHPSSFFVACVCYLLGSCCYHSKRYGESLRYLDKAVTALKKEKSCLNNCVRLALLATYRRLHYVKVAMGKRDEANVYARNALEIMESSMDENFSDLCNAYKFTYAAYVAALDAEQAIPLCLKALDMCIGLHGEDSTEVVQVRVDLAILYRVVGKREEMGQQRELWTKKCNSSEVLKAEIKGATMLFKLGWYQEAFDLLNLVLPHTAMEERVSTLLHMVNASYMLKNFIGALKYMKEVKEILEANDFDSIFVNTARLEMSALYEKMNDLNNALSLSKRVCEMNVDQEIHTEGESKLRHQKLLAAGSRRLFRVAFLACQVKEELHFMESVAEKLEKLFGPEHIEVGDGYARFGEVLMNSGLEDLAVKLVEKANDILNVGLGPHHLDSLKVMHILSQVYVKLGRHEEAAEIEVKVKEHIEGLEPSEQQEFMDKAVGPLQNVA